MLTSEQGKKLLERLENAGIFFAAPLDLDFSMLRRFPSAYKVTSSEQIAPDDKTLAAVLGKKYSGKDQYNESLQKLFGSYQQRFKLGSKPAAHLEALATLDDASLKASTPVRLSRLLDRVQEELKKIPE